MNGKWELFSHQADMGIRGTGPTFEKAFEQAGLALTAVLINPSDIEDRILTEIEIKAPQIDYLFYDWINELVYHMAHDHLLFNHYEVKIFQNSELSLKGKAWGERINPEQHQLAVEVKGATLTELKAEKKGNGIYIVQCVVDI